jgi:hypothetical protein
MSLEKHWYLRHLALATCCFIAHYLLFWQFEFVESREHLFGIYYDEAGGEADVTLLLMVKVDEVGTSTCGEEGEMVVGGGFTGEEDTGRFLGCD